MDGHLIRFRGVSFRYDDGRQVFDGLDLDWRPDENIALCGPNGSGKTTLLHLCVGLLRPQAGEVEVLGKPRKREADFHDVRARVGLLFQDPDDQLFCPTVAEDVAFGPFNLGLSRAEVEAVTEETLASLGLRDLARRTASRLSHGEKKMAALASVLAMRPRALLLDEPTAGLDPDAAERLVSALERLRLPALIASHDFSALERLGLRRVRLQNGKAHNA